VKHPLSEASLTPAKFGFEHTVQRIGADSRGGVPSSVAMADVWQWSNLLGNPNRPITNILICILPSLSSCQRMSDVEVISCENDIYHLRDIKIVNAMMQWFSLSVGHSFYVSTLKNEDVRPGKFWKAFRVLSADDQYKYLSLWFTGKSIDQSIARHAPLLADRDLLVVKSVFFWVNTEQGRDIMRQYEAVNARKQKARHRQRLREVS